MADDGSMAQRIGHNGINGEKLNGLLTEILENFDEIDAIGDEAKKKQAPYRDRIKEIKAEAAACGFGKKEFGALVSYVRKSEKIAKIDQNMDDEQKETFDQMLFVLLGDYADTPLGRAAIAAAKGQPRSRPEKPASEPVSDADNEALDGASEDWDG